MKRWWLSLSGVALLFALFVHSAVARLELSAEEREMVEWSRSIAPRLQQAEPPDSVILVDDYVRRSLRLGRCSSTDLWKTPDRWLDRRYASLISKWVREMDRIMADDMRANAVLETEWEAVLILAWRSWDRPEQLEWLHYMRSTESKRGFEWWWWITELESIDGYATDVSTGHRIPVWVTWVGELLALADLSTAFVRAANAQEPGLGDTFAAHLSWPPGQTLSADQRRAREDLVERLVSRWADIVAAVPGFADPEAVRMGRAWSDNAMVQRLMMAALDKIDEDFLAEAGLGPRRLERTNEALLAAVLAQANETCAALQ